MRTVPHAKVGKVSNTSKRASSTNSSTDSFPKKSPYTPRTPVGSSSVKVHAKAAKHAKTAGSNSRKGKRKSSKKASDDDNDNIASENASAAFLVWIEQQRVHFDKKDKYGRFRYGRGKGKKPVLNCPEAADLLDKDVKKMTIRMHWPHGWYAGKIRHLATQQLLEGYQAPEQSWVMKFDADKGYSRIWHMLFERYSVDENSAVGSWHFFK